MANLLSTIFVLSEKASRLPDLISGARKLGEQVAVLCVGGDDDAQAAINLGANHVYLFAKDNDVLLDDYVYSFAAVVKGAGQAMVMMPSSKRGKAMAAKLGAMLNAPVVNDTTDIVIDDALHLSHVVYGGLAICKEKVTSAQTVITVGSGVFEADEAAASIGGAVVAGEFVAPLQAISVKARQVKQKGSVDLSKAKYVVGVGRGFAKQDDLALASELAAAIGGEVGCSRPIAEGEGWVEHERYIGVSGVLLHSDAYVAVGISGQIQHMAGANAAKTIIAINKDKNAPIFNFADYGIVGDIYKVLPALITALKA